MDRGLAPAMEREVPMRGRRALLAGGSMAGLLAYLHLSGREAARADGAAAFAVSKTDAAWRKALTPAQYAILRGHGTEPPWSSPLDHEFRKGIYACAGCGQPVFSSDTKFDSGTGWPSFWKPIGHAVATSVDTSFLMRRTEVHCGRCGGHLGHVFHDGPPPTGLRYCIDGIALRFQAA